MAYGAVTFHNADGSVIDPQPTTGSPVGNPYLFTGRRLDPETGLFYYRARYYDVLLGRFISRDPIGIIGGTNLYRAYFVPNSTDPFGLDEIKYDGNDVFYQDEGWFFKWDYADGKYHIGTKVGDKIVFDQRYHLPPTDVAVVEACGSADNLEKFLNCVQKHHDDKKNINNPMPSASRYFYVVEECQIVLVYGHGGPAGHVFVPQNNSDSSGVAKCWAAGFVGCYSSVTNGRIPEENRSYGLPMTWGTIYAASHPDWHKDSIQRMREGATKKAKELCAKDGCCCKEINIVWRIASKDWLEDRALLTCPRFLYQGL